MCDMRGFLSFQILWILSKNSMCGDGIAKELEIRRGEKPKAGTIYPALKELRINKLISGKKNGREIVYTITPKGTFELKKAKVYFFRSFGDILKETF